MYLLLIFKYFVNVMFSGLYARMKQFDWIVPRQLLSLGSWNRGISFYASPRTPTHPNNFIAFCPAANTHLAIDLLRTRGCSRVCVKVVPHWTENLSSGSSASVPKLQLWQRHSTRLQLSPPGPEWPAPSKEWVRGPDCQNVSESNGSGH